MMMGDGCAVVVPYVSGRQRDLFFEKWKVSGNPDWLILQPDPNRRGSGITKNEGIAEAVRRGAEMVVVLDDDCFPYGTACSLPKLAAMHLEALKPQPVELFQAVTMPPSRGTPYFERSMTMPVAASMGFWEENGDHCAVRQLAFANGPMAFQKQTVFGRYFPLCGMNIAFKPKKWDPWCRFIEVHRFDDIWMGWLWQKEAYRRGYCFNLAGPVVHHSRQSNVWKNLGQETLYLEENETLWRKIAESKDSDYASLRKLLPLRKGL